MINLDGVRAVEYHIKNESVLCNIKSAINFPHVKLGIIYKYKKENGDIYELYSDIFNNNLDVLDRHYENINFIKSNLLDINKIIEGEDFYFISNNNEYKTLGYNTQFNAVKCVLVNSEKNDNIPTFYYYSSIVSILKKNNNKIE